MKKLRNVRRTTAQYYVKVVKTGKKIPLFDVDDIVLSTKVNLVSNTYINPRDMGYAFMRMMTICELLQKKELVYGSYLKRHKITIEKKNIRLTHDMVTSMIFDFYKHGFSVSRKAIEHNYNQWMGHTDSGYRGNGYHLKTEASLDRSRLTFEATSLSRHCADWQQTYPDYN